MTDFHNFKGAAKRLDDVDLPRLAAQIECGEDELHAFMDVEAAGSGFDEQGRPKILFEPHVFYRNLSGKQRTTASSAGLAYPKWGEKLYGKESDQYPKLLKAIEINETAALKAASWGVTQILGENFLDAGYATPQAMVLDFMADEENHIAATVRLLVHMNIADDLAAHKWAAVARGWNGSGYAKNKYDTKMAAAYAKWAKIKDTAWEGAAVRASFPPAAKADDIAPIQPAVVQPRVYTDPIHVRIVQETLYGKGYTEVGSKKADGTFDGSLGTMTKAAILLAKSENGIQPINDVIDDAFIDALPGIKDRILARADATDAKVRDVVPEAKNAFFTKILAAIGLGGTGVVGAGKGILDFITPWKNTFSDVPSYVWIGAIAAFFIAIIVYAHRGEKASVQAFQDGGRR